ncbi:DNA gyrase [Rhizobiaceae bacterium BDR2-2]|uniref:DNA gyrase n=1 Tax=Ectorhizobium quercum TaxID=2965071 RepID=A0AAE3N498_9HYPH|nr:Pnap_2097 family protein [Ectorhizobium quercum]MCX8999717.1 DNA gyrase [Ectorhizobium quercum]
MMPRDHRPADAYRRALVEAALCPGMMLGMPHLTPFGLSRTWLLEELGHRHWLLLARRLGLETADFRTPDGLEAYAAISALRVDARLSGAGANAVLSIHSDLYPVSGARMESVHRLAIDGREIGTVVLQSVFVVRTGADNRSIRRSVVRHFRAEGAARESLLTEDIAALRLWDDQGKDHERDMVFQPCPFEEFNGAGLFYFAEFAALVGRAFCHWEGTATRERLDAPLSLLFLGNIEPGEAVRIGVLAEDDADHLRRCSIERPDGSPLARALCG